MKKILLAFVLFLTAGITVWAQAPQLLNYEGIARSSTGAPLVSVTIGLQLTIHDGSSGGAIVYQETQTRTTNGFGLYNASIGGGTVVSGTFSGINWAGGPKYMEVGVDPTGGSTYTSAGTAQLLSVPYSIYSNTAGSVAGGGAGTVTSITAAAPLTGGTITTSGTIGLGTAGTAGSYGDGTHYPAFTTDAYGRVTAVTVNPISAGGIGGSGTINYVSKFTSATAIGNSSLFDNGTSVGLGTLTPSSMSKLEVSGVGTYGVLPYYQAGIVADGASTLNASGVFGQGGWRGVFGYNPGTYAGVEAMGVLGRCEGSVYSGTGYGVKGENTGTGGTANFGTYGIVTGTAGTNIGAYGSGATAGVYGTGGSAGLWATASGSAATYTPFLSPAVVGVVGKVRTVASGRPAGMMAISADVVSTGQSGILALADSNTLGNYGVEAYAAHSGGAGSNYAIYGNSDGSGAVGSNYAGYFQGAIYATSANASIKSFKIDHPGDPANKYLYHSSIESNDMMNLYNGNVVTDAYGDATITLPSYFTLLNKDYKYQLTCIGQFAQAIVKDEISGNAFTIKTDKPNVKVSWQVAGVRQDPAANAYRIKDEVEKPAPEKGTYLMPELYGYGPEMAPGYKTSARGRGVIPGDAKAFPSNIVPVVNNGNNTGK